MTQKTIIIPARYASSRYPGKPLAMLKGASGVSKSLIQRSWEAAKSVPGIDRVIVATDDDRIKTAAEVFGAEVMMTPESCRNGTERCAYVAQQLPECDLFVNLQGDAPLTPAVFVTHLLDAFSDPRVQVATPIIRCGQQSLESFKNDRANGRVGGTTVIFNADKEALYFSKEVLPYTGEGTIDAEKTPVYHHVGVYAYRREMLQSYTDLAEGPLEKLEGLEQLRFLHHKIPLSCVEVSSPHEFWELNNPTDVPMIEEIMKAIGLE